MNLGFLVVLVAWIPVPLEVRFSLSDDIGSAW